MGFEELLDFVLDGLLQHSLSSLKKNILHGAAASISHSRGLCFQLNYVVFSHVCVLFAPCGAGFCRPSECTHFSFSHTQLLIIPRRRKPTGAPLRGASPST